MKNNRNLCLFVALLVLLMVNEAGATNSSMCLLSSLPILPSLSFFTGWTISEICSIMGTILTPPDAPPAPPNDDPIPASFDWRSQNPNCIAPAQDQGRCGCCYLMATATALASRLCIAGNMSASSTPASAPVLSTQHLLNCDNTCSGSRCQQGCNGGYLDLAWKFATQNGDVTRQCRPYVGQVQSCQLSCSSSNMVFTTYKPVSYYSLPSTQAMQRAIKGGGPITVGMQVYSDFLSYDSGVYSVSSSASSVGGHAVVLLGWGTANGVDYWIGVNSWSSNWGENGFFRIRRNTNEAQIESYAVTGSATSNDSPPADAATRVTSFVPLVLVLASMWGVGLLM